MASTRSCSAEADVGLNPGRYDIYIRPPSPIDRPRHGPSGEEEVSLGESRRFSIPRTRSPSGFNPAMIQHSGSYLEKEPARLDIDLRD